MNPKIVTPPKGNWNNFTYGKNYEVLNFEEHKNPYMGSFNLINDNGNNSFCLLKECSHIGDLNWTIIE